MKKYLLKFKLTRYIKNKKKVIKSILNIEHEVFSKITPANFTMKEKEEIYKDINDVYPGWVVHSFKSTWT